MHSFIFDSYEADFNNKEILFRYVVVTGEKEVAFTEKLSLPASPVGQIPTDLLDNVLHSLHIMFGISYWKLYCPREIKIKTKPLSKDQAEFWNAVYTKGLGEFFYKNKIDFRSLISFPYEDAEAGKPISFPRTKKSLVGIGGGKDSVVAAQLLREHDIEFSPFLVETNRPHAVSQQVASQLGSEPVVITRSVDPQLFELNKESNAHNGHVPISAIFAWIGVLSALLYDYSYIIVGNERSAEYGNTEYLGSTINHQWSKTIEFEELFQRYVKTYITSDITYFSLLRPFSEYAIAGMFSKYPKFFSTFTSCNRNFTIHKEVSNTLWCGECPKCAFTFIMLAVFVSKDQLIQIFGQNLLEKESLVAVYKELLGVEGIKPFECVGTPEEVKLAFYKTCKKGEFNESVIMKYFEKKVMQGMDVEKLEREVTKRGRDLVPEEFKTIIRHPELDSGSIK